MSYVPKVGDVVKLRLYRRYGDYKAHRNQEATIKSITTNSLPINIVWSDGTTSSITVSNTLPLRSASGELYVDMDSITSWKELLLLPN